MRGVGKLFNYSILSLFTEISTFYLFRSKVNQDIDNAVVSSVGAIKDNITDAISNSNRVEIENSRNNNKWITNKNIWKIDNSVFQNPTLNYIIEDYSSQRAQIEKKYSQTIKKISSLTRARNFPKTKKIEFYVALVQPAFFVAMKQVIDDANIQNYCEAKSDTQTGPETIERCIELCIERPNNKSTLYSFVAPQFAYTTLETYDINKDPSKTTPIDPKNFFIPIINLTNERQEVLFLEGKDSLPRENKLFYLNNSTAEEYTVDRFQSIDPIFSPVMINDFSEYKMLLKGEKIRDNIYMKEGDGIVLWEPLTTFYMNRKIRKSHLKKPETSDPEVFQNYSNSKIMLFVESDLTGVNSKYIEFYNAVMKAFILKVSLTQQIQFSRSSIKNRFNKEISLDVKRIYKDGHEGFFKKLFA